MFAVFVCSSHTECYNCWFSIVVNRVLVAVLVSMKIILPILVIVCGGDSGML